MHTLRHLPGLALLALGGLALSCGDNHRLEDAGIGDGPTDASIPAAPVIGAQLDRMGRPAITLALVGTFRDIPDLAAQKRDAYDALSSPATWATSQLVGRTVQAELAANLGILDVLDRGNGAIPGQGQSAPGCRNQLLYNGNPDGGGTPTAASYDALARILADDMLYVDTSKATCTAFLSLELEAASGGIVPHTQCGGRAPTHDVIDATYSAVIAGINGFSPVQLAPLIGDGVAAHADVSDSVFPYFGPPH